MNHYCGDEDYGGKPQYKFTKKEVAIFLDGNGAVLVR